MAKKVIKISYYDDQILKNKSEICDEGDVANTLMAWLKGLKEGKSVIRLVSVVVNSWEA